MHKEIIMDYTTEVFISAYNTVYSPTWNLCKTIGLSGKFVSILKENWNAEDLNFSIYLLNYIVG